MRLKYIVAVLFVMVLVGCSNETAENEDLSMDNGVTDIKELVHDYSVGTITDQEASITATELIVTSNDDNSQTVYELPEEEFFVSIAPFISETHPCFDHSLTGCQGELVNEDFDIHIEDKDGNVVVDEEMNSGENGFLDFWLPRNQDFFVTIIHNGQETKSEVSTFEEDGTCITTIQL